MSVDLLLIDDLYVLFALIFSPRHSIFVADVKTWTTYRRHSKFLEMFHQRCLRSVVNISWGNRKIKISVLEQDKMTSIEPNVHSSSGAIQVPLPD